MLDDDRETIIQRWEEFLDKYAYREKIVEAVDGYPDTRSLEVDFNDIDRFDDDLLNYFLERPRKAILYAEEAMKRLMPPQSIKPLHFRAVEVPRTRRIDIRDIRASHLNKFISVEGLVKRAQEVRPKLVNARFRCVRCSHEIEEVQDGRHFREPMECYKDQGGCGRSPATTKFTFLPEESEFIDYQSIEVQEKPEGLRGGQLAQSLPGMAHDDLSGEVIPGDEVAINGILSGYHRGRVQKLNVFDIYMDINSIMVKEKEFQELDITPEEEAEILSLAKDENIIQKIRGSIAPTIYGMEIEKEALALQLFGGVRKIMPDGTKIRGDIHILLVGDPGTAKCVSGDTEVVLADGSLKHIKEIVEDATNTISYPVDDGLYAETNHDILSLGLDGKNAQSKCSIAWKRSAPAKMYCITTASGRQLKTTPTHPLFVCTHGQIASKRVKDVKKNDFIATPRRLDLFGQPQKINIPYTRSRSNNAVRLKVPLRTTPRFWRYVALIIGEGYINERKSGRYTTSTLSFTNNDKKLLVEFENYSRGLGLNPKLRKSHPGKAAWECYVSGIEFCSFLENLGIGRKSRAKMVPDLLFKSSKREIASFLSALFDCEGTISKNTRQITMVSASERLLRQVQHLLLRFGIISQVHPTVGRATNSPHHKKSQYWRLHITGADIVRYKSDIGFTMSKKREILDKWCTDNKKGLNTNIDVIPDLSQILKNTRRQLRITQFECGRPRASYQHYERGDRNPSTEALKDIVMGLEGRIAKLEEAKRVLNRQVVGWSELKRVRILLHLSQEELAARARISQTLVSQYETGKIGNARIKPKNESIQKTIHKVKKALSGIVGEILESGVIDNICVLKTLSDSHIFWDRIDNIEEYAPKEDVVYDLQVPMYHNFIANDFYVHNSQLLSYIGELAPRGIYASGKSATAAGLCVAPDTLIPLSTGELVEIGQFVESKMYSPEKIRDGVWKQPTNGFKINTIGSDFKINQQNLESVWRLESPKNLYEIRTRTNRKIVVSADTPLPVKGNGTDMEWIKASGLETKMYIAAPRILPEPVNPIPYTIELIDGDCIVGGVSQLLRTIIERLKPKYGTVPNIASHFGIDKNKLYYNWIREERGGRPTLGDIHRLGKEVHIDYKDIAPHITYLSQSHGHRITVPMELTPDLLYFAGLVAGDGTISKTGWGGFAIRFSNSDPYLMETFVKLCQDMFSVTPRRMEGGNSRPTDARFHSKIVAQILEKFGIPQSPKSNKVDISPILQKLPNRYFASFLRGLYDSDGSCNCRTDGGSIVELYTSSEILLKKIQILLLRYGIISKIRRRDRKGIVTRIQRNDGQHDIKSRNDIFVLGITGTRNLQLFKKHIDFTHPKKKEALRNATCKAKNEHTNWDVVPNVGQVVKEIREAFGLSQSKIGVGRAFEKGVFSPSRAYLKKVLDSIQRIIDSKSYEGRKVTLPTEIRTETASALKSRFGKKELSALLDVSEHRIYEFLYRKRRGNKIPYIILEKIVEILTQLGDKQLADKISSLAALDMLKAELKQYERKLEDLHNLVTSDIFWDQIVKIRKTHKSSTYIYDLTVNNSHNFIANGVLVHNTAAAVRDEHGDGRWTLEAGALVLADLGIACIDELDKMSKEDRSSMHEAMEQQCITVAKAGINSTLQSRCAVLGAANPKLGRFARGEDINISEQTNMPPALLSRFDIIFPVTDVPNTEKDTRLSEHVLKVHLAGEIKRQIDKGIEGADPELLKETLEVVEPPISREMLRKYIAYAKNNIFPRMTTEVKERLKTYYVDVRKTGQGEDASVPITVRQLEAFIRLSEASAKARLSNIIEMPDADRAIKIVKHYLTSSASEAGHFDIDIIATGVSRSQRDQLVIVRDVIRSLSEESDKGAALPDIVRESSTRGVEKDKVQAIVVKLKRDGVVYELQYDHYRIT